MAFRIEPSDDLLGVHADPHQLDGDTPLDRLRLLAEINDPHASLAEHADDSKRADLFRERVLRITVDLAKEAGIRELVGLFEIAGGSSIDLEEGIDLLAQRGIRGAFVRKERFALGRAELKGFLKDCLDAFPAFVGHVRIDVLRRHKKRPAIFLVRFAGQKPF
ncbi:MAG: hypothetical protein MK538_19185 [Planctomycetes bacterium]|nr:hypothetical protein [Planctomycetota bacterium]